MEIFDKSSEEQPTPEKLWKNILEGCEVTVSDANLQHAILVFQEFDHKTSGDQYDTHIHTNVLILASVFDEFRKVSYANDGRESVHSHTVSSFSGKPCSKSEMLKKNFQAVENFCKQPKT